MQLRRTLLAATAATTVVAASWTASSAAQPAGFANGTAKATAMVSKLAPGVGNLQLALAAGASVAEIRNDLAQAQARAGDMGLIGTSLTAEGCDGGDATFSQDQLPQPLRVDNRKGNAEASEDEIPIGGAQFGGGRMEVSATDEPGARAVTTTSAVNLAPVFTIGGGRAEAITRIVDGNAREAVATATASMEIAGVLKLEGMTWRAIHRTGAGAMAEGSFQMGSVAGQASPLGVAEIEPTEPAINQALAQTGISIQMPKVIRLTEPADVVRVTPMRIILKDSPALGAGVGPVLEATREQRQQLFTQIAESFCDSSGALLVADVGLTIAAGAGFLAIELGGVEATTAEVAFEDPFGAGTPAAPGSSGALPASGSGLPSSGGPATPPSGGTGGVPGSTGGVAGSGQPIADAGPIERVCESVNPVEWPPCSHGAALPLGLAGLGVTAGVAALDWRLQTKRRSAAMFA